MEDGFMGGVYTPLYDLFWFLNSFFKIRKRFFASLQASMVNIFHFSDEWNVVSVAPQRGVYTPHKSRGVFYTHIGHGN